MSNDPIFIETHFTLSTKFTLSPVAGELGSSQVRWAEQPEWCIRRTFRLHFSRNALEMFPDSRHSIVLWNASGPKAQCILSPLGEQDQPLMEAYTEYEIYLTIIHTLTSIVLCNSWGCHNGKVRTILRRKMTLVIMPSSPYHSSHSATLKPDRPHVRFGSTWKRLVRQSRLDWWEVVLSLSRAGQEGRYAGPCQGLESFGGCRGRLRSQH